MLFGVPYCNHCGKPELLYFIFYVRNLIATSTFREAQLHNSSVLFFFCCTGLPHMYLNTNVLKLIVER